MSDWVEKYVDCHCGSSFKVSGPKVHGSAVLHGECLSCNRSLTITPGAFMYPGKDIWSPPSSYLKCKCGSEFFSNKFLREEPVMWLKCNECGEEKDLRELDIYIFLVM